ncbi:SMI1/KNR4 family protein [Streptomyces sp. TRM68367]|uniref:SMI1/KNR4 family protein n=1 Tax=Streptomyces sp. TRM68367 TaxID=2758415 RepID=UPI00165C184D|nr:SMI1/KNR4 family protein [Streptomyces sp. TRM68367]MBC9725219.1 SMI1/KNR4 family protein [Streptomyces sp. TRM68367]
MTTMPSVDESWNRILSWLEVNAPATGLCVNPPAADEEIATVARALGAELPADLVTWWHRANGMRRRRDSGDLLPPDFLPHTTQESLASRQRLLDIWAEIGDPRHTEEDLGKPAGSVVLQYLPVFVPIAGNESGDHLFVDLRHGPRHGCVTEYDHEQGALAGPCWSNVTAMLADVANGIEHGVITMQEHIAEAREHGFRTAGYLPRVTEDLALDWEPSEGA